MTIGTRLQPLRQRKTRTQLQKRKEKMERRRKQRLILEGVRRDRENRIFGMNKVSRGEK